MPKAGLLGDVVACLRSGVPQELQTVLNDQVLRLQGDVEAVHGRLDDFWSVVGDVVRDLQPSSEGNGDYDARLRITENTRSQAVLG